jgi:hypothetical protein
MPLSDKSNILYPYSMGGHNAIQHNVIQHNAIQHNAIHIVSL